jgi:hypothetical protein
LAVKHGAASVGYLSHNTLDKGLHVTNITIENEASFSADVNEASLIKPIDAEVPSELVAAEATLEQLLEYYGTPNTVYSSDTITLEAALKRAEELTQGAGVNPFDNADKTYELGERLKGGLRYLLAERSGDGSQAAFSSFEDLQMRMEMQYQHKPSIEDHVERFGQQATERLSRLNATRVAEGKKPKGAPIIHLSGATLLGAQFKTREWLLEPLLKEQSTAMLYADAGVGKTWFTWTLVVAIAGGGEIFGWKAAKPRRVWVIDGEMHYADLKERLEAVLQNFPPEVPPVSG